MIGVSTQQGTKPLRKGKHSTLLCKKIYNFIKVFYARRKQKEIKSLKTYRRRCNTYEFTTQCRLIYIFVAPI